MRSNRLRIDGLSSRPPAQARLLRFGALRLRSRADLMAFETVVQRTCGKCRLPVMACPTRLALIVRLHRQVRGGPDLGLERLALAVAVEALLAFCQMRIVVECHLSRTCIPLLILRFLLESEWRWNLRFGLSNTVRGRHAHKQETRKNRQHTPSDHESHASSWRNKYCVDMVYLVCSVYKAMSLFGLFGLFSLFGLLLEQT